MNEAPNPAITGKWKALLGTSLLAALLVFLAGFYYYPLGNDGGWYSFPAAAMSQGASPAQNLEPVEALEGQAGLRAKFPFKTYASVRVAYTALWLELLPRDIVSLKLLGLLELIALAGAAYLLFLRFCKSKLIAVALVAVLVNDKQVVMGAAWDYRPDNVMAALGCLAFAWLLTKDRLPHYFGAVLAIGLMALIHLTAPVPLAFILSFLVFKELFSGNFGPRHHYKYVLAGAVAVIVLLNYNDIVDTLMSVERPPVESTQDAGSRVAGGLTMGVDHILSKEFARWRGYFPSSNLTQLVVLVAGFVLLFRQLLRSSFRDPVALALASSTVVVLLFLAVFDPHKAPKHVVLVVPMLLLFLGYGLRTERNRKAAEVVLAIVVGLVTLSSFAVAAKYAVTGGRSSYNIASVEEFIGEIVDSEDHKYLIVGPTELWPFVGPKRNVLFLDHTRSRDIHEGLTPVIGRIDYVILNGDYAAFRWKERFLGAFPDLRLKRIRHLGGSKLFVTAYRIETNSAGESRLTEPISDAGGEAVADRRAGSSFEL